MRKELFIHFSFLISFFILIAIFKRWFNLLLIPFFLGGVVGTILPDIDHFLYVYLLNSTDLTSQRAVFLLSKKDWLRTFDLLAETRYMRTKLIFHTVLFQLIFVVLAFWVVSSSGNIFGRGLVLGFLFHLVVDEFVDFMETGSIATWIRDFPLKITFEKEQQTLYFMGNLLLVLLLGFIF